MGTGLLRNLQRGFYTVTHNTDRVFFSIGRACRRLGGKEPQTDQERKLNELLTGYPRNHQYQIVGGKFQPTFWLHERAKSLLKLFPEQVTSFLDIGCCRGYYVFQAARSPQCTRAVGIDVHKPFIEACSQVRSHLGAANTEFRLSTLEELARDPAGCGGPFQTVLLVGAYHYLYWGSSLCADSTPSHRAILERLARLCTGRVIFSARLEIEDLPRDLQLRAEESDARGEYTTEGFLRAAEEFFEIRRAGRLEEYPAYILERRQTK